MQMKRNIYTIIQNKIYDSICTSVLTSFYHSGILSASIVVLIPGSKDIKTKYKYQSLSAFTISVIFGFSQNNVAQQLSVKTTARVKGKNYEYYIINHKTLLL